MLQPDFDVSIFEHECVFSKHPKHIELLCEPCYINTRDKYGWRTTSCNGTCIYTTIFEKKCVKCDEITYELEKYYEILKENVFNYNLENYIYIHTNIRCLKNILLRKEIEHSKHNELSDVNENEVKIDNRIHPETV